MENNFHVETVRSASCDSARGTAHTDKAQGLAGYAGAHHVGRSPSGPFAVTQMTLPLSGTPGNREQQCHRQISGAVGEHFRGVGDGQAGRPRRLEIYMIEADAVAAEYFGADIIGAEYFRGDLVTYGGNTASALRSASCSSSTDIE